MARGAELGNAHLAQVAAFTVIRASSHLQWAVSTGDSPVAPAQVQAT